MSIWFGGEFPLEYCNRRNARTLNGNLGIELLEAGADYLKGSMPVDERTANPAGVLHGGASIAFAETLASWAGAFVLDSATHHCVGLDINGNHVRPAMGAASSMARPGPLRWGARCRSGRCASTTSRAAWSACRA